MTRFLVRDFGTALNFSGASNKIDCGSDFIGTSACTITAWINARSLGGSSGARILDNGKTIFKMAATSAVQLQSDGATTVGSATSGVTFKTWAFISATRTSVGVTNIYINGVLSSAANQSSGTPASGTTNVVIGNNNAASRNFDGFIDEVRVYNRVLSSIELLSLYYNGITGTGQISSYLLDEGSGTTAIDSSGSNTGTITGATYTTNVVCKLRNSASTRTLAATRSVASTRTLA